MLHIKKIALTDFATHKNTEVGLPAKGLVALIGPNGSGKSTLLEAVATALWGESLRGEAGWRQGTPGAVSVITDQLTSTRRRSKAGSAKLEWDAFHLPGTTYENTTKAQAALETLIGSYDVWRRTCVLSSLDSAAFSLARDSDRKRLLEEFLGLDMFDTALEACRQDRKEAQAKAQKQDAALKELSLRVSFVQSQLEQYRKDQATILSETGGKDADTLKAEGQKIAALHKAAMSDAKAAADRVRELERTGIEEEAKARAEEARLSRMGADTCPTCGQDVKHTKASMASHIQEAKAKAKAQKAAIVDDLAAARADASDLEAEAKALEDKLNTLRADYRIAEAQTVSRKNVAEKVSKAEADLADLQAKVDKATAENSQGTDDAQYLEAVEYVLGLRGVRAQVLDKALGALEQQANAWLSRMPTEAGPLVISLTGSTTQKSGSVVDAIALKVGGRPYASCSGGERRRVDVAILLALRELAVASSGRDGSLFCDEVFDALDTQGQADVSEALREMAEERLVLVITHSPELVSSMRPDLTLEVSLVDGIAKVSTK